MTDYEKALARINRAYVAENFDLYELRIARAAKRFGKSEWKVAYDATIAHYYELLATYCRPHNGAFSVRR